MMEIEEWFIPSEINMDLRVGKQKKAKRGEEIRNELSVHT